MRSQVFHDPSARTGTVGPPAPSCLVGILKSSPIRFPPLVHRGLVFFYIRIICRFMTSAHRRVLITGGASGLGRGIAEAFLAAGDTVVIADVDADALRRVAVELGSDSEHIDISDPDSVTAGVDAVLARLGGLDVLVNNAGIVGGGGLLIDLDVAVLDAALAVNVRGTFLMTQAVGRAMVAA